MPLLALQITEDVEDKTALVKSLSSILSTATGKPETYCMVTLTKAETALFGGTNGPAAFADVRGIGGFKPEVCQRISASVCTLLADKPGIREDRVYLNFMDIPASHWGWNRGTF